MMALPPTNDQQARKQSDRFQAQFDILLFLCIITGLVVAIAYGVAAGTCPPDPQQLPRVAAAASPGQAMAPPAHPPPGIQNPGAQAQRAAAPDRAPTRSRCETGGSSVVGALLALIIALAALAIGTFVGFLFGLPRSLTSSEVRAERQRAEGTNAPPGGDQPATVTNTAQESETSARSTTTSPSDVNTNLERISDWLTTIIVGVGLTNLGNIAPAVDDFGDNLALYFGYGGKIFGIAAALYFLIAGFFLSYVGTRVKLSLIFALSQWLNRRTFDGQGPEQEDTIRSRGASPARVNVSSDAASALQGSDTQVLERPLESLRSPDDLIAWANAKARAGDPATAISVYRDVLRRVPFNDKLFSDFAALLGMTGQKEDGEKIVGLLRATSTNPTAGNEAVEKLSVGLLRNRLREGLWKPRPKGFEESIEAGEALLTRPDQEADPWVHVWLASAYGQKHGSLKEKAGDSPTKEQAKELKEYRDKAVTQIKRALALDPRVKSTLQGMYDKRFRVGEDDDLDSLNPDDELNTLLLDMPPPTIQ